MNRTTAIAVAGLGVTQIIGWGSTNYLLTIMAGPIVSELRLAPEFVALGQSALMVLSAGLGPLAGRIMDINGARLVMASGSVLSAAGLAALALATGPASYLAAWCVIGVSCTLILYPAAFTALTQLDPANARRNITLLTLPGGLASTVFWPLGTELLHWMDWRQVVLLYALLNLTICAPIHLLTIRPPRGGGGQSATKAAHVQGLPDAARPRAFLLFAAVLALHSLVLTGLLNQFIRVLVEIGHSADFALRIGVLFGIAQVASRIVESLLSKRYDALHTGISSCALLVFAMALMPFSPAIPGAGYLFAMAVGASSGLLTIMRGALTLSLFGSRGYGQQIGAVAVAQGFTAALAPVVLAGILTRLGPISAAVFCVLVAVAALVAMLALFRHARRHQPNAPPQS